MQRRGVDVFDMKTLGKSLGVSAIDQTEIRDIIERFRGGRNISEGVHKSILKVLIHEENSCRKIHQKKRRWMS